MAKDPAVLFYTQDFLVGTMFMSSSQRGWYITILCQLHQQKSGSITESEIKKLMGREYKNNWPAIQHKFLIDNSGYYNDRMRKEIEKRRKHSLRQSENASMRWHCDGNTKAMPLENVNENVLGVKDSVKGEEELWDQVKLNFTNDFHWTEKFCRDKNLSPPRLKSLMKQFIDDLELKEEYKDLKELKRHFTNWYNKNVKNFKSESNGDATEFVERINREKTERILSGGK